MKKLTLTIGLLALSTILLTGCNSNKDVINDLIQAHNAEVAMMQEDIDSSIETQNELRELLREKDEVEVIEIEEEVEETIVEAIPETKPTYSLNVEAGSYFEFIPNKSRNVFRNLTGVNFMNELNAIKVKAPTDATTAKLTVALGREGEAMQNAMYTWNVTVGYESCKINEVLDRDNFPHTRTIDLANVDCKNRGIKNFLPLLKDGVRVSIYNAQLDGTTYGGFIKFD